MGKFREINVVYRNFLKILTKQQLDTFDSLRDNLKKIPIFLGRESSFSKK